MEIVVFLLILGAAAWFVGPMIKDKARLTRENQRVINITKQTKRDMDNLARRQRREDGW